MYPGLQTQVGGPVPTQYGVYGNSHVAWHFIGTSLSDNTSFSPH